MSRSFFICTLLVTANLGLFVVSGFFLLLLATDAWPHDAPMGWSYDYSCCSTNDCREVKTKADPGIIDLVPLAQFSERIAKGWTMVPGYPLNPGDYAVTMRAPGFAKPKRNVSAASAYRNRVTAEKRKARKLAEIA